MNAVSLRRTGLLTVGLLAVSACADGTDEPTAVEQQHGTHAAATGRAAAAELGPEVGRWLAQLRRTVAPYHRLAAAEEAGWDAQITGCMELPGTGGMGWHYGNVGLIDATPEALAPELLVYAPSPSGGKTLVAVEYVVPFDAWTDEAPPSLLGVDFHRNEAFGLWVLHAWIFKNNPDGIFADWNPTVSCASA